MHLSSGQSEQPPPSPHVGDQPTSASPSSRNAAGISASDLISARQWSTGLCDCCSDVSTCCLTYCCACIVFGRNAEIIDMGATSCVIHGSIYLLLSLSDSHCIYAWLYRSKMRQRYMLPEKPCHDCLVHCCCHACALCQEYRELKHHGFKMSLGWKKNMERRNHAAAMMPPSPLQDMER
ncbi:hypothetical protein R6Q59_002771 [Mikania micrantha]